MTQLPHCPTCGYNLGPRHESGLWKCTHPETQHWAEEYIYGYRRAEPPAPPAPAPKTEEKVVDLKKPEAPKK
jgi:hypothetical protein